MMRRFFCRNCGASTYAYNKPTDFKNGECSMIRILPTFNEGLPPKNYRIHHWIDENDYDPHEFDNAIKERRELDKSDKEWERITKESDKRRAEKERTKRLAKEEQEKEENEAASLRKKELEQKEKQEREQRANELMSEGKTIQAYFVRYKNAIIIGGSILAIALFLGYQQIKNSSTEKNGAEINLKLESIETQVKIAIQDGDQDRALKLDNQLVHPLHEQWKDQSKFDTWNGYPYYDDYWTKKREEYLTQILAMSKQHKK